MESTEQEGMLWMVAENVFIWGQWLTEGCSPWGGGGTSALGAARLLFCCPWFLLC